MVCSEISQIKLRDAATDAAPIMILHCGTYVIVDLIYYLVTIGAFKFFSWQWVVFDLAGAAKIAILYSGSRSQLRACITLC